MIMDLIKNEEDETKKIHKSRKHVESNLFYSGEFTFYKYQDIKNLLEIPLLQKKKKIYLTLRLI